MNTLPRTLFSLLPLGLLACSGATTPIGASADGGDAGSSTDSGGGGGGDGGVDCNALLAQLDTLQAKAQQCCPNCNIVQCTGMATGLCCPITVNMATSQAAKDFEAARVAYEAACPSECPAIACLKVPSGVCDPSGVCR